jgi:hypothetical protein
VTRWRAGLAVVVAAVVTPLLLMAVLRGREGEIVRSIENGGDWYARSPAWFTTRGLYPTEHAPDGAPFAWAGGRLRLQVPQLDRRAPYTLRLRARSGRAAEEAPAVLRVLVDGIDAPAVTLGGDWQEFDVPVPRARGRGVSVALDAQQTFTPGPQDPRALGFMIDRVTLAAADGAPPGASIDTLSAVALFAGAVALAAVLCGAAAWSAAAAGLAAGAVANGLLVFDSAFLGAYSSRLLAPAAAIAVTAAAASLLASMATPERRQGWRTASLLVIVATAIKLAVFLHPAAPIGDGMFHVHRAQAVRAGQYIFTSITPQPFYEFPYPIGLYVAAQPLWDVTPDRVVLLRALTLVMDGVVALGLFAVVAARWGSSGTGVLATVLALAFPLVTQSVSTANLSNVFAQSCFSAAVAWIGWCLAPRSAIVAFAGATVLLSAAYLSHFSTAVIGIPAACLIAAAIALARADTESRSWRWVAAATGVSIALAYGIYYSQFHDVYARTWSRIGQEGAETSFVATLAEHSESKTVTVARFLIANYGWAGLALAAAGVAAAIRRDWRDGWTLVLGALGVVVGGFLILGAVTPIEMRANLAAQPLVACFAALGCAWLWNTQRLPLRAAAAIGAGATVWLGLVALRAVLG